MTARRPAWQKLLFCLGLTLVFAGVGTLIGESVLRALGRKAWNPDAESAAWKVEPGGTLLAPDEKLGFVLRPGQFTVTSGPVTFHATNQDSWHRISRPEGAPARPGSKGVWIFGDSFTYGWCVDDKDTFAYKLQEAHPELDVQNFAVGGYSTVQSMLQLEAALERAPEPPTLVLMVYSSFLDGRNAMLRGNRKRWGRSTDRAPLVPVASMKDAKVEVAYVPLEYKPWPLETRSAFVNFLEESYNRSQAFTSHAELLSRALIERSAEIAKAHHTELILLGIYPNARTAAMLRWAESRGIRTLDIAVDYNVPENRTLVDAHPSPLAHTKFAKKIESLL